MNKDAEYPEYPAWFCKLYEGQSPEVLKANWSSYSLACLVHGTDPAHGVTSFEKGETKPSNPKDRAATNRLDLSLFPMTAIIGGALAMTEGDCKYGGYNYRVMGVNVSTYIAALDRHKIKFYNGEWADPKTGIAHLDSMIACCAILRDGFAIGNINDDRPPKVDVSSILNDAENQVARLHETFPNGPERFTEVKHGNK